MPTENASVLAAAWLDRFNAALAEKSHDDLAQLFLDDAEWRDIVAVSWDFSTVSGAQSIADSLIRLNGEANVANLAIDTSRTKPSRVVRAGEDVLEAIYRFDTAVGAGAGVIRLVQTDGGEPRARLISTTLQELHGHEERRGARRPEGTTYSRTFGGKNWTDLRHDEQKFEDRQPDVLIVGGGQAGLGLAARLRVIGVDALIVDKLPRIGDVWRQRYHHLTLHNQVWAASFPYLEFPDTWPAFLPKDKLAGWMEYYADAMELNVWNSTSLVAGDYDEDSNRWKLALVREGAEVTLYPKHLVFATGTVSGEPSIPQMPGLDEFRGEILHSSQYQDGARHAGSRALVIGTGTSSHDVAQDLHAVGADVTMVQRSSTTVVGLEPSGVLIYDLYSKGLPLEDADLISGSNTYQTLIRANQLMTKQMLEWDADLLERLEAVGFKLDIGEDETGFHLKYSRRGGGYYINVGCSDLIADKQIGLLQADTIARFTSDGVELTDGERREYDLLVFGTGYSNQQELIRQLLGSAVADRVGGIWGVDEDGEMRNMWRPTAQPGLWFHAGSLALCRANSKYLALQIKADLEGLNPRTAKIRQGLALAPGVTS
ncbi:FAD-dependent oxidoreductase [Rhodococcus koreensis]